MTGNDGHVYGTMTRKRDSRWRGVEHVMIERHWPGTPPRECHTCTGMGKVGTSDNWITCPICRGTRTYTDDPAWSDEITAQYVSVYEVTRERGGHEEGGWWYDHHALIYSVPTDGTAKDVDLCLAFLATRFHDQGDIGSVLGGTAYLITAEPERGLHETKERPTYE